MHTTLLLTTDSCCPQVKWHLLWLISIYPVLYAPLWALIRSNRQMNCSALDSVLEPKSSCLGSLCLSSSPGCYVLFLQVLVSLPPGFSGAYWATSSGAPWHFSSWMQFLCGACHNVCFLFITTCLSKWTKLSCAGGISFLLHFRATYSFWHSADCKDILSKWFEFESYRSIQEDRYKIYSCTFV